MWKCLEKLKRCTYQYHSLIRSANQYAKIIKDQEVKKSFTVGSTLRSLLFKVTIFCELVVWRILRVINFTLSPHAQVV